MKKPLEKGSQRKTAWWLLWTGSVCLFLATAFVLPASSRVFAQISFYAKYARSEAVWYLRSGQWRADLCAYKTHVEHLFCPSSGAGARIDLELDD